MQSAPNPSPNGPLSRQAPTRPAPEKKETSQEAILQIWPASDLPLDVITQQPHHIDAMSSRRIGLTAASGLTRRIAQRPTASLQPCACCQWHRSFTASTPLRARTEKPASGASMDPKSEISGPAIEAPRSYGKRYEGAFTPKPLPRPIGMPLPPREGENSGIDHRSREQRKKDFGDYDKHLARRKEL